VKRTSIIATLAATLTSLGLTALPAQAAATSASIDGHTATLVLDAADDNVTVSAVGGVLVHGQVTGGLASGLDWDSVTAGDQTVPADGTFTVIVNGGAGNDVLAVTARGNEIAGATLNGDAGDDVLTGGDTNDNLIGGDGNDRLTGGRGADDMRGGAGNDTLVWDNGDGSDVMDGEAGSDGVEVNGSPALGDTFTIAPDAQPGHVVFKRTNLVPFTLQTSTERFQVNGLGGDDSLSSVDGVGADTLLSADGGTGNDTLDGSDGPDLILGGDGNDVLTGGGGDDRLAGDRGNDTMNGGAGDDALVWNNGDGTDVMNGDAGRDDVEVNGAPTAGDVFSVQPNGERIRLDRPNLVPFSLDIGSSETMHADGLGGADSITVGDVGGYSVTAAGGPGDDTLTGGASSETFLGGSGNDVISPGGGIDFVSGDEGDDQVDVRDATPDVAVGGAGSDSVVADADGVDIFDGFETVDRTPNDVPNPVISPPAGGGSTRPVTIMGGKLKVTKGRASLRLSCPPGSSGDCTGSLSLRSAAAVRLGGVRARLQLGSARYDIPSGATRTVTVKLVRGLRSVADRRGHLDVVVFAYTGAQGSIASSSRRATLTLRAH
jgi:Ca2+-binding RTX toxin-like protein